MTSSGLYPDNIGDKEMHVTVSRPDQAPHLSYAEPDATAPDATEEDFEWWDELKLLQKRWVTASTEVPKDTLQTVIDLQVSACKIQSLLSSQFPNSKEMRFALRCDETLPLPTPADVKRIFPNVLHTAVSVEQARRTAYLLDLLSFKHPNILRFAQISDGVEQGEEFFETTIACVSVLVTELRKSVIDVQTSSAAVSGA